MKARKNGLTLILLMGWMLFFCFLGAARADNIYQLKEDTSKWAGTLTNLEWFIEAPSDFWMTTEGDWIGIPKAHYETTLTVGVKADFDLDIKEGTLGWRVPPLQEITTDTPGLSLEKISDTIRPGGLPDGVRLETYLRVGSTRPIKLKGSFENKVVIMISSEKEIEFNHIDNVEFTCTV